MILLFVSVSSKDVFRIINLTFFLGYATIHGAKVPR